MKKILLSVAILSGAFAASAGEASGDEPAWKAMLAKVKNLPAETGVAGFMKKEAPAYITGNFAESARPAAPDFSKPLSPMAEYANRNGFWVNHHCCQIRHLLVSGVMNHHAIRLL